SEGKNIDWKALTRAAFPSSFQLVPICQTLPQISVEFHLFIMTIRTAGAFAAGPGFVLRDYPLAGAGVVGFVSSFVVPHIISKHRKHKLTEKLENIRLHNQQKLASASEEIQILENLDFPQVVVQLIKTEMKLPLTIGYLLPQLREVGNYAATRLTSNSIDSNTYFETLQISVNALLEKIEMSLILRTDLSEEVLNKIEQVLHFELGEIEA
ncbi:MAG: hypothetical protein ABIQ95_12175, partial [Bdellovibrionia bacterium]